MLWMFSYLSTFCFPEKMKASSFLLSLLAFIVSVQSQSSPDTVAMQALKASLENPTILNWFDPDPCRWSHVKCSNDNRVTRIIISSQNLKGGLPSELKNLTSLTVLEVANNFLTGPIPSLAGLSSLQKVVFSNNSFSYMPPDFFTGLTSLQSVSLDYNPFSSWEIPESLKDSMALQSFSANQAGILGTIPEFLGGDTFPGLIHLHLAMNNLQGQIPWSFGKSSIQTLWLNGQRSNTKLNGSVAVLRNMTSLTQLWLHDNLFSGPLPDLSALSSLEDLSLRDNKFTGIVPQSVVNLPELTIVNFTNNLLQGPTPRFNNSKIKVDRRHGSNSFCFDDPGVACDERVNILLSIAESMGYPLVFAQNWKGNDPCNSSLNWKGISCDGGGNIGIVNFHNLGLFGTISSNFSMLTSLKYLTLSNNSLMGTIPYELTTLKGLKILDVSNNHLCGKVPIFRQDVLVKTDGNPDVGKDCSSFPPQGAPPLTDGKSNSSPSHGSTNSNNWKIVGYVIGAACGALIVVSVLCLYTRKRSTAVIHPRHSGDRVTDKVPASGQSFDRDENETHSQTRNSARNIQDIEMGPMVISIQSLRNATNNFNEKNILGKGGFGTVYKGEMQDRTKIAVKRMEPRVISQQGLAEFKSEITVLTKVRHRHLVALLGYCLDGNERLLAYEFMPQGTLSRHLFNWQEEGLKPLEWTRRLTIALDVARGVEYLHGLARQRFIHRDLKPSNILLGDDMRAKVADFGLVRLVPENLNHSIETRVAGTFGYLAPDYIVRGRVTVKVDVYSFGVVLMELITGKKAIAATISDPENVTHLSTLFRRMHNNNYKFQEAIDKTIELDGETFASVSTVAVLAGHCCAREPYQRPDMSHVVNVLSSLAEQWKPSELYSHDIRGIDLEMNLTP